MDASKPTSDRADVARDSAGAGADALLAQVRAGIDALESGQNSLDERAQALLAEASELYEALRVVAAELATVRREQSHLEEIEQKLRTAAMRLQGQESDDRNQQGAEPDPQDSLAAQTAD